jgi:hypothetical protein
MATEPTTTEGTFFAVLDTGVHITHTGRYWDWGEFKTYVRWNLDAVRADHIVRFFCAFGTEVHEYTPNEVREVFFGR